MATNLELLAASLGASASDAVVVFVPRFALEAIRGTYDRLYYELDRVQVGKDDIQAWLDAGESGMADPLLVEDIIEQMAIGNGHLEQIQQALYTVDDVAIADVMADFVASGSSWTAEDIASALSYLSTIAAAL